MRHRSFTCAVCSAPNEIRELIDRELSKPIGTRKPLRVLAALGGFSKSGLSRHDRNCLSRARLEAFRDKRKKAGRIGRIILKDSTVDGPPVWTIWRNPYDEHAAPEPFQPREGFQRDDLFLVLTSEALRPEVIARANGIQIERASRLGAAQITEDEPTDGQDETEQP